jgi:hypothetical protein
MGNPGHWLGLCPIPFKKSINNPAAERPGYVVLQGMDFMRVNTPANKYVAGSKPPQGAGVLTRLRIKKANISG